MRKFFLCAVILIFSASSFAMPAIDVVGGKNNSLHKKKVDTAHTFIGAGAIDTDEGSATDLTLLQAIYGFDSQYLSGAAGIQFSDKNIDVSALGVYWILRTSKQDFGVGGVYHFYRMQQVSATNDFLLGVFYNVQPVPWFSLSLNFDYMFKMRSVYAVRKTHPVFANNTIAVFLRTNFYPTERINFFLEVSSYEFFRYMIFCAPSFGTGVSVGLTDNFSLIVSARTRYIDFFTLSAGYDNSEISFAAGYKF